MHIANIAEIRQNASKIIARVLNDREPTIVLQRSKPVAYIIEASVFEEMQKKLKAAERLNKTIETKTAMQNLNELRKKMAERGRQSDSTQILREIREGLRNE
ncbi:MAG: antitoxin StbD [Thermosediminibacterales bacterium]|nr:antitoxin StbD [Thermosediminibacterales bacterium]